MGKVKDTDAYKYVKKRIDDELKKFLKDTVGKIVPGIFADLPMEIIKVVLDDDKFWKETIFIGLGNYIRSKKSSIIEILNILESDLFDKVIDYVADHTTKGEPSFNVGENIVRNLLAGNIADSERDDFISEPIQWVRDWLESDESITVAPTDDVKHSINNILFAILFLIGLALIIYIIISKPKLNIGHTTRILIENVFNNIRYNDKTVTGSLIKSILNVVDSWIKGDEKGKFLKNVYLLLRETNKIAKSLNYLETSLMSEYTETELAARKFKVKNERINNELAMFNNSIGKNAKKIMSNILEKGGLWKGDMMDYVLADLIFARVKVEGKGEKATFSKREGKEIIDWTDKESRKQHPLSKVIENNNSFKGSEIFEDFQSAMADAFFMLFDREVPNKVPISNVSRHNFFVNEAHILYNKKKKEFLKKLGRLGVGSKKIKTFKQQIEDIKNHFTFNDFYTLFGVDFVVTGANITSAQPVYFNYSLTPSMPVIKAVRISSNFPILFQPIKLNHKEKEVNPKVNFTDSANVETWVKNKEDYYKRNYSGFFIDGGLLNNLPMNVFNKEKSLDSHLRDPKSILDLPPNSKVLGLKLGSLELENASELEKKFKLLRKNAAEGEDKRLDSYSHDLATGIRKKIKLENPKFDRQSYKFNYPEESNYEEFKKKHIKEKEEKGVKKEKLNSKGMGFFSIVSSMFGTTLDDSMDGRNSAFFDENEQIVRLYTGRISLFDLVTKESELNLVDLFSYSEIYKHFHMLDSLHTDWEKDLIKRLKRNSFLRKKWRRNTRDRNRLRMKRRHY